MSNENKPSCQVLVSEDEYKIIKFKAEMLGLAISNYLRMVALHANVEISIDKDKVKSVDIEDLNYKFGPKQKMCQMRVTDNEYKIIESKANLLGLNISNYLRMVALHANIIISIQPQILSNKSEENLK